MAWAIVALVTPYFFLDGIDLLGTILYRVVFYGLLAVAFALDLVTILSLRVVRLHTVDGCSLLDEGDALEPRVIAIPLWGSRRALAKATWSRLVAGP